MKDRMEEDKVQKIVDKIDPDKIFCKILQSIITTNKCPFRTKLKVTDIGYRNQVRVSGNCLSCSPSLNLGDIIDKREEQTKHYNSKKMRYVTHP